MDSHNRNASDEVNALLNYGYAVLESEVRKDVNSIGLDPSISFLHELSNSRASLVYDVQELYRWLVDLSVTQLLEEKKLKKADFIVTESYNIRLRENTAKALMVQRRGYENDFILPLFKILGWNVEDSNEVSKEENAPVRT